jgi:hypothetical protein
MLAQDLGPGWPQKLGTESRKGRQKPSNLTYD